MPYGPLAMMSGGAEPEGHIAATVLPHRSAGLPETMVQPGTVEAACGSAVQRLGAAKPSGFGLPACVVQRAPKAAAAVASSACVR